MYQHVGRRYESSYYFWSWTLILIRHFHSTIHVNSKVLFMVFENKNMHFLMLIEFNTSLWKLKKIVLFGCCSTFICRYRHNKIINNFYLRLFFFNVYFNYYLDSWLTINYYNNNIIIINKIVINLYNDISCKFWISM